MKQKLTYGMFFLLALFFQPKVQAQTLSAGDIAFIGYDTGITDGFTFIALKNLPAGETIFFTEEGWNGTGWGNQNEAHLSWVIPSGITIGTIINVTETSNNFFTVTPGYAGSVYFLTTTGALSFSLAAGDQIIAYQSSTGAARPSSPTFIAAVHGDYDGSNYNFTTKWNASMSLNAGAESVLPTGLTNGVNCVALYTGTFGIELNNSKYTGTLTGIANSIRLSINDAGNWQGSDAASLGILPANYASPFLLCTSVSISSSVNVSCNGGSNGSAIVTASGGDLTYNWTPGNPTGDGTASVSGLAAGTYRCTVSNSCGSSYVDVTITEPSALSLTTFSLTNVACFGGSTGAATVNPATGGTSGYTYNWTPGNPIGDGTTSVTGLTSGNWTCTVTDANGCTTSQNFMITQPTSALSGTIAVTTEASSPTAADGVLTVTPSGGTAAYSYLWNNAGTTATITGLAVGTYTCTITDANGCTKQVEKELTSSVAPPVAYAVTGGGVSCSGTGVTIGLANSETGISYQLKLDTTNVGDAVTGTGEALSFGSFTAAGSYTVVATPTLGGQTISMTGSAVVTITSYIVLVNETAISCAGETVALTATTGTLSNFTGAFAPANWTFANTNANGTVNTASAPASIAITGGNGANSGAGTTDYSITMPVSGTLSFNWSYSTTDGAQWDYPQMVYNDATNYLTGYSISGGTLQSSSVTMEVVAGETLVLRMTTVDNTAGAATVVISNFSVASSVTGTPSYAWTASDSGVLAGATDGLTATATTAGTYTLTATVDGCSFSDDVVVPYFDSIEASAIVTNASCNGASDGFINLTPSGGTAGYTFDWGGDITTEDRIGLAAGNYSVTITDANGCTATANFTITQPAAVVSGTTVVTNTACNGLSTGSIDLTPTGGTPGYTYNWGGGITTQDRTGLSAGSYSVEITDANGCTGTVTVSVTQPSIISGTTVVTNTACNGLSTGSIDLTPTGGTPGYTYNWGGGITTQDRTGLSAGNYSVEITDANGCTGTVTVSVTQPSIISGTTVVTNTACNGLSTGSIDLTPTGGTPGYTYNWGGGITTQDRYGLSAGNYSVEITDANGCTGTVNVTVTQPNALLGTVVSQTNVSCNGGNNGAATVLVSGGSGGYTYTWSNGSNTSSISGVSAGVYNLYVIDSNGCGFSNSFQYGALVASVEITEPSNPISGTAVVNTPLSASDANDGALTVTASGGTAPYTYAWSNGAITATITGLIAGTYTCWVTDANNCVATAEVVLAYVVPAPVAYAVTGGGQTCPGADVAIGLDDSETGVTYQLKLNGTDEGTAVAGTGSGISFGDYSTAGTYTVEATSTEFETTTTMTGNAVISTKTYIMDIPVSVVACNESTKTLTATLGTISGFSGSLAPANWTFSNDNTNGTLGVNPNGSQINFTRTNDGTYSGSGSTDYSITLPYSGTFSFNWSLSAFDETTNNYPQLVYNGTPIDFTGYDSAELYDQSGSMSIEVEAGASLAFRLLTLTNSSYDINLVINNLSLASSISGVPTLAWTATNGGVIYGATDGLSVEVLTKGTYMLTTTIDGCLFSKEVEVEYVASALNTTTWNGTEWSNGVPDTGKKAIIDGPLIVQNYLHACEMEITENGSLTIPSGANASVNRAVENNATASDFVIENNGIFNQGTNFQNEGPATVHVNSFPLYRQDYTLWSSPVKNQNLRSFSTQTLFNRFSSYDTSLGTLGEYVQELFTWEDIAAKAFLPANGYLIRMPNNWVEYVDDATPGVSYPGVFKGVLQNGTINVPLSTANVAMNLVGNPYPSPIYIPYLFTANPAIEETIYFWRKRNGAAGSGYATYNSMGFVSVQPGLSAAEAAIETTKLIKPGQGFFVKSTGATQLNFYNSMRRSTNGAAFLKQETPELHRYKLNLSNATAVVGQTLIGYATGATAGVDSGYDSSYFNDSDTALTSLINGAEYIIQGLGLPFDATTSVALGFKTESAGTYTISLATFDGLFAEGQNIYIKDNLTGTVHNVKESAYSFTTVEGIFNSRFEVVYQSTLSSDNPNFDGTKVMVYKQDNAILINTIDAVMQKVELYDVRGSLIQVLNDVNQTTARFSHLNIANQVVLVKITTVDHQVTTKKIVF